MDDGQKGLKQLLGESFRSFREGFGVFTLITFLVYVPVELLNIAFFVIFGIKPGGEARVVPANELLLRLLLLFISAFFYFLYQIALIKSIASEDKKTGLLPFGAYQQAFSLLGPYAMVVGRVVIKVFLWSLLLLIPGIIFGVFYSFSNMAFLLDGKKGREALMVSKQVIKPHVWKFVGNGLAAILFLLPVYLLIAFVVSLVFGVYNPQDPTLTNVIGLAVGNALVAVVSVYLFVFFYALYKELKARTDMRGAS